MPYGQTFCRRLAEPIRVPKQLLEDAMRLKHILDVYDVSMIEPPICVPAPVTDSHTTLEGILKRMLKPGDPRLPELKWRLSQLTEQVDLETRIKDQYIKLAAKQPIVHSEIQVLEHFHRNNLTFADNDRFVGTSKLSCFCCKLYFRHHSSRPVEPDSHEEVYLSWGPIQLPAGSNDSRFLEQRDILNLINRDIRNAALERLINKHSPQFYHPNFTSGVSRSADSNSPSLPNDEHLNSYGRQSLVTSSSDELEDDSEGGAAL
ncbi:Fc.00g034250.m01.CDS01 [Cosmosporella sp. VM-42]